MAPPPPIECDVPGFEFKTPEGLLTYDHCLQRLQIHASLVHANNTQSNADTNKSKPDKLKRPSVSEGITEADWVWFEDRWNRYKKSTGLVGEDAVNQLWDCATKDLARRCYECGPNKDITEGDLLVRMKRLSLKAQNKLVNTVGVFTADSGYRRTCGNGFIKITGTGQCL